VARNC